MTQEFDFDAVVVGAGAVGLTCSYALSQKGLVVAVLEAQGHIGQGVSSRNSEVIHGGLYYPTGSLKARFCVEGRRKLYAFLDKHHVDYKKCGKLVVATNALEVSRLDDLFARARANNVPDIETVDGTDIHKYEPVCKGLKAIWSPHVSKQSRELGLI
jgi:L-2-hydroxyglutarate oxidase LhgO